MCEIEAESWEYIVHDRATLKNLVKLGVSKYEQEFIDQNADKEKTCGSTYFSLPPTAAAASEHGFRLLAI